MAFLKWYTDQAASSFRTEDSRYQTEQPVDVDSYRDTLLRVNWSSSSAIDDFSSGALGSSGRPGTLPIYLGTDNSYRYHLRTERMFLNAANDLPKDAEEHPSVMEMRNVDQTAPPFRYGFCLGCLDFAFEDPANTAGQSLVFHVTPFRIYLDVLSTSKAIWLVFDPRFQDILGEIVDLGPYSNTWQYLPSPQNGRDLFNAFKIMEAGDLGKTDEDHSFFENIDRGIISKVCLQSWVAARDDVEKAVATSNRSPPLGG